MVTPGGVPHEGGKIISGCQTVLIEDKHAATLGDVCLCNGGFLDVITSGSSGVFIEGKPAARQGDLCSHGGMITSGSATVLIGETMNPDLIKALIENKIKSDFKEPSEGEKIVLINQAIRDCIALLERKLVLLEQEEREALDAFMKWFGRVDEEAKQTILTRIRKALEVSRTLTVDNFDVIEDQDAKKCYSALVNAEDKFHTIFLGDKFWKDGRFDEKSMGETLIHELSHFHDIGSTIDVDYGVQKCLSLVETLPGKVLDNADSFKYFVKA
jgi:uncharacterized Zn-binding protein involved in type VI secretion